MTEISTRADDDGNVSFPGKIAVITTALSQKLEDFHSAEQLVAKYGADKVIHLAWPVFINEENKQASAIVSTLAEDMEIKALIINQAMPGTNSAVKKLREIRDDIFTVFCTIHESYAVTTKCANLLFEPDEVGMGPAMVKQSKKQGARAFIHYSFPRHMSQPLLSHRRDLIRKTCEAEGIQFIDASAPDPTVADGLDIARKFILEDVPRLVARYGEDTAFFTTNCGLQMALIKAVVDCHAIYPQPCCPSPYHGFPEALGIQTGEGLYNLNSLISEISSIAAEKNMTDRLSTWPVSASMMFTNAGAEYAIKWIRGEVPRNRIDDRALEDCMNSYIREVVGEGVEVAMTSYSEGGIPCDNFKLLLMSYLDF